MKLGMTLKVTSEGLPGAVYAGRITRIAPTADLRMYQLAARLLGWRRLGRTAEWIDRR